GVVGASPVPRAAYALAGFLFPHSKNLYFWSSRRRVQCAESDPPGGTVGKTDCHRTGSGTAQAAAGVLQRNCVEMDSPLSIGAGRNRYVAARRFSGRNPQSL